MCCRINALRRYNGLNFEKLVKDKQDLYFVLNELLNGKRPVTTEYALLFEAALELEAESLIKNAVEV
jgi:hypothetical protein